jgi:hypothetical protein
MRRAGPVVAKFLAFGEVAPGVEGLVDGDEVGEIDHDFREAQVGDAVAVAPFETDQQPRAEFTLQEGWGAKDWMSIVMEYVLSINYHNNGLSHFLS